MRSVKKALIPGLVLGLFCNVLFAAQEGNIPFLNAKHSVFFVGGTYTGEKGKELMQGQMFVEKLTPVKVTHKYPLILIHGAAQTSVNWLTTPDGRIGWAHYFVEKGYEVYMIDQPARGRSAWHPSLNGPLRNFTVAQIEKLFTASEQFEGQFPQAYLHTQWPGEGVRKGRQGDSIFDQFYASQVESVASHVESSQMMRDAGAALLDKIGPAILLTHSQAGPFGWLIADARPKLVKGIVAIEPSGPPIQTMKGKKQMPWGVSEIAINYKPSISSADELKVEQEAKADGSNLAQCWLQSKPAKKLINLENIPILMMITESSYHAQYDHCTSKWLTQAGVKNDLIRLEDVGIHGNGHMLMLEKNNLDIAEWINKWISHKID